MAAAAALAAAAGLQAYDLPAPPFVLRGYGRFATPPPAVLPVYLEGDGLAWESRSRLSRDPTPRTPVALLLAAADPAPSVAWLGRPCQYLDRLRDGRPCPSPYWAEARFAPEVVAAANEAVDRLKALAGAERVELIGFSGGGGLAVLMAAARHDVAALVTVAGNLDHRAWTAHHRVTPMAGSLNPADAAAALGGLPQLHLTGERDAVMPAAVALSYRRRLAPEARVLFRQVPGQGHDCCWPEVWPQIVAEGRSALAALRRNEPGGRE